MKSKSLSLLQKTYDETYLTCSTALYHEGRNNEGEALLSWRKALNQIQFHNANRPSSKIPKSATEKSLLDSLKSMEDQCRDRIGLLEALKLSRLDIDPAEAANQANTSKRSEGFYQTTSGNLSVPRGVDQMPNATPDRGGSPISLPPGVPGNNIPSFSSLRYVSSTPTPQERNKVNAVPRVSRTPSPEKRGLLSTLRTPRKSSKPSNPSRPEGQGPAAAKAASLAWSSISKGSRNPGMSRLPSEPTIQSARHQDSSISTENPTDVIFRHASADRVPSFPRQDDSTLGNNEPFSLPPSSRNRRELPRPQSAVYPVDGAGTYSRTAFEPPSPRRSGSSSRSQYSDAENLRGRPLPTARELPDPWRRGDENHTDRPIRRSVGGITALELGDDATQERLSRSATSEAARTANKRLSRTQSSDLPAETASDWQIRVKDVVKTLPDSIDRTLVEHILSDIVLTGDEVHWDDIAGLDSAKLALKEAVIYPFLRPDLFRGLREPARGILLFGPPGTGKTMLARALATESHSTFFSLSASSLTSKYLGESEKLVKALFLLAKALAPSIIFIDEIDSLLGARSSSGEHEATRRIKTEFLIQWSELQRAAAGRESSQGDPYRVLVLAATNLPWAIDEAARRRFVRRQYIPLPDRDVRCTQLKTLLKQQTHKLTDDDIQQLADRTDGFSGSDITALAKDAAMGPLRSLGDALLHTHPDHIRGIFLEDFRVSLRTIKPSVSKEGLNEYEDWSRRFGERA